MVRIGFFGDSYVESVQVPLEQTFFRQLPEKVAGQELEALAFGIGGWGTLHSLIAYEALAGAYDIDIVIYLFTENDMGNNSALLDSHHQPHASLSPTGPGFRIDSLDTVGSVPWWHPPAKFIKRHLLLAQLLHSRIRLLRQSRPLMTREQLASHVQMSESAGAVPRASDLPGTWPDEYAAHATALAERILAHWVSLARDAGQAFLVFYVPRSEAMLTAAYPEEATWRPWLGEVCDRLGVPVIDPREAMLRRLEAGDSIYGDHWTATGHEVVRDVLAHHLARCLRRDASSGCEDSSRIP